MKCFGRRHARAFALLIMGLAARVLVKAQTADGNAGINQATTQVKGYFDTGVNLMKVAAAWFGSCIFLVVVATVLKSFFGL